MLVSEPARQARLPLRAAVLGAAGRRAGGVQSSEPFWKHLYPELSFGKNNSCTCKEHIFRQAASSDCQPSRLRIPGISARGAQVRRRLRPKPKGAPAETRSSEGLGPFS